MDADFCKYMMGIARFQALADAFTKLLAAQEIGACRIIQDMLHAENVKANTAPKFGAADPAWADEKSQEFDNHEENRDYGSTK